MTSSTASSSSITHDLQNLRFFISLSHRLCPWAIPVMIVDSLLGVAAPYVNLFLSAAIFNELIGAHAQEVLFQLVLLTLGLNFLCYVSQHALRRGRDYQIDLLYRQMERQVASKFIEMDYDHIENPRTQELYTQYDNNRQWVGSLSTIIDRLCQCFQDVVNILVSLALMIQLFLLPQTDQVQGLLSFIDTPWAAVTLLAIILGSIVVSLVANVKSSNLNRNFMQSISLINRRYRYFGFELPADYRFGKDIRLYNMSRMLDTEIGNFQATLATSYFSLIKQTAGLGSLNSATSTAISSLAYLFVALKAMLGSIAIGSIVVYVGAITQFSNGLTSLVTRVIQVRTLCQANEAFRTFVELPPVKYRGTLPVEKREDHRYEIEFRNVSFRYPGAEEYMLKNISLKLRIGERLAVVGMNGAGKTTFIKLLCRLYDPTEGEILLNGIDIRKYDYQEYLNIFSVVFQDFKIFAFPVGQNVATATNYDEQLLWKCLEEAGVADRVQAMPKGLETSLYKNFELDGVEISGGEAQKMAIARALYKDAPFIILDEPTAALDPLSEYEIYSRFNDLVGGKTAVYISHRLSSCRFCHDIAVFHEGRIIQRGSHEELLQNADGKYFELWNAQAKYYAEQESKKEEAL